MGLITTYIEATVNIFHFSSPFDMDRIILKVKRLDNNTDLPLPSYESDGSSGLDLRAAVPKDLTLKPGDIELIPTGLSISLPQGYEAQIRARSGLALRHGLGFVNAPGTIDSDYRGEIGVIAINWGKNPLTIKRGDRIAQMVVHTVSKAIVKEVNELDTTQRGEGGFGHSGC
jgi:dUTP pyrophosphatase